MNDKYISVYICICMKPESHQIELLVIPGRFGCALSLNVLWNKKSCWNEYYTDAQIEKYVPR